MIRPIKAPVRKDDKIKKLFFLKILESNLIKHYRKDQALSGFIKKLSAMVQGALARVTKSVN